MSPWRYGPAPSALLVLAALTFPNIQAADAPDEGRRILELFVKEFVPIKPASFTLGSKEADAPASEKPAVTVKLTRPFQMARYEVTQELYQTVMGTNPARWKGKRNSVEMVSWDEANTFCRKATALLRERKLLGADEEVRLPSEAEWEYCCRAGTTTRYSFGDSADELGAYAWYSANSKGEDPPVGRKKPNVWGLYDMHGYVSEWCADDWVPSHEGAPTDGRPVKKKDSKERVIKGGSFADPPDRQRCAWRDGKPVNHRSDRVGFRCVRAHTREEK